MMPSGAVGLDAPMAMGLKEKDTKDAPALIAHASTAEDMLPEAAQQQDEKEESQG